MLYTEDFSMRHYVGFSQIGSHILLNKYMLSTLTFLTVLYFEVGNLCIALTLTILPGIVDFWFSECPIL